MTVRRLGVDAVMGPSSPFARRPEGYEHREGHLEMARAVFEALAGPSRGREGHLFVEAARRIASLSAARAREHVDLERPLQKRRPVHSRQRRVQRTAEQPVPVRRRENMGKKMIVDRGVWKVVRGALLRVADVRLETLLAKTDVYIDRYQRDLLLNAARKVALPTLIDAERDTCTTIAAALDRRREAVRTEKRCGAELLASIYDAPDDDAARLVYADWLTQAGDPRGEFIVLQFQRRDRLLSREGSTREKALLRQFLKAWLGEMDGRVRRDSVQFERGFPRSVRFVRDTPLRAASSSPWATVEEIDLPPSARGGRAPAVAVSADHGPARAGAVGRSR